MNDVRDIVMDGIPKPSINPAGIEVPLEASFGSPEGDEGSYFDPEVAEARRKERLRLKIEARNRQVASINAETEQLRTELEILNS
jgi:hypothetical protein